MMSLAAMPSRQPQSEEMLILLERHKVQVLLVKAIARRVRKAQHPLANGDARDDTIYAVRREVRHAFAAAAGTKATSFARERDEALTAAGAAAKAAHAVFQHAAAKEF